MNTVLQNLSIKIGLGQCEGRSMRLYELLYKASSVILWPYTQLSYHYRCLGRALAYFKQGYSTYDFDYCYLVEDIIFKLRRIRDEIGRGYNDDKGLLVIELNHVICLGDKILNYNYEQKFGEKHDVKWGGMTHTSRPSKYNPYLYSYEASWVKAKTKKDKKQALAEFMKYMNDADKAKDADRDDFFDYIKNNATKWWD